MLHTALTVGIGQTWGLLVSPYSFWDVLCCFCFRLDSFEFFRLSSIDFSLLCVCSVVLVLSYIIFAFHVFVFLDSTPGSAGLSETVGGEAEATVHLVSPSIVPQGTPCDSFLLGGSFEEKARKAHATSSPELTPTGVPYPSIDGHTLTPVDSGGFPCRDAGSPSLRDSQGRPVRPLSTLSDAGLWLQSISAWYLFKEGLSLIHI